MNIVRIDFVVLQSHFNELHLWKLFLKRSMSRPDFTLINVYRPNKLDVVQCMVNSTPLQKIVDLVMDMVLHSCQKALM